MGVFCILSELHRKASEINGTIPSSRTYYPKLANAIPPCDLLIIQAVSRTPRKPLPTPVPSGQKGSSRLSPTCSQGQ